MFAPVSGRTNHSVLANALLENADKKFLSVLAGSPKGPCVLGRLRRMLCLKTQTKFFFLFDMLNISVLSLRSVNYWRDVRAVQCACFENRCTITGTGGSNPSLSAEKLSSTLKYPIYFVKRFKSRSQQSDFYF